MHEVLYSHSPYIIALSAIALVLSLGFKKLLWKETNAKKLPEPILKFIHINIVWNLCALTGSLFLFQPQTSTIKIVLFTIQALAWVQTGTTIYRIGKLDSDHSETMFSKIWNTIAICAVLLVSIFAIFDIRILTEFRIMGLYPLKNYPIAIIFSTFFILFVVPPIIATMYQLFKRCMQSSSSNMVKVNTKILACFITVFLIAYSFDFILPIIQTTSFKPDKMHFLFWNQCCSILLALLAIQYFTSITYKNKSSYWLLSRIINQINDGIICYHSDGRIKSANPIALQMFQTTIDELQTKYIQEIFSKNLEFFRESHYKNQKISIKNEIHKFDIKIYQSHLNMLSSEFVIQFSDLTNTLYYQQRIRDLNEQYVEYKQDLIRYQDRLNISEKRSDENRNFLFTLINALPFQFWSKNEQGVYVMQNQKDIANRGNKSSSFDEASQITEYEIEARTKGVSKSFISYETVSGRIITQDEANVLFREGKEVFIFDNLFIPIVTESAPYKVIGLKIDMTEQRKLEKERDMLREQKYIHSRLEELGTLCGAFAHDYNNILGSQIGFCDLAKESIAENHPAYMFICEARKAAERGKQSLEELLSTIRGNTSAAIPPIEFSPHIIIKDVVVRFTQSLPKGMRIVSTELDEDIKIMGVVASFERVITNIMKNGIDAMKSTGGQLTIRMHSETLEETLDVPYAAPIPAGSYAKISISDTGTGMDAGTLERIFSPFFTTKAPGEGLGLGLSSAVRLLKEAKASFNVQTTLGKGTTFNLYWPKRNE
ncbi:MAG: PAS domain-containing protein [Fibrobacter sp.]|nr:PAS domain-containing protein [Fibrobacter sp.]